MAQGIGFAVPSNTANWVTSELIQQGKVRRMILGISIKYSSIPVQVQKIWKLPQPIAVEIVSVEKGSLAQKAKLEAGDLVVKINDKAIVSVDDIHREIGQKMQERVMLTVLRNYHLKSITLQN